MHAMTYCEVVADSKRITRNDATNTGDCLVVVCCDCEYQHAVLNTVTTAASETF